MSPRAERDHVKTFRLICRTALPLLLGVPVRGVGAGAALDRAAAADAEDAPPRSRSAPTSSSTTGTADIVTATGEVRMNREGYHLRADSVSWNRRSGEVRAEGGVRITNPGGDVAYGDSVVLEDTLKDGVVQNMLIVLADGGRLAAISARAARRRHHPPPRRLYRLRGGRRPTAARRTRPGRSTRSASSTIRSATASPIRARRSTCSACRSSACPACRIRTAARAAAAASWCPRSATAAATASSSASPYYLRFAPNRDADDHAARLYRRAADARGANIAS